MGRQVIAAVLMGLFGPALGAVAAEGETPAAPAAAPAIAEQKPNTWVKRQPVPGSPTSPRLGYESSMDYDPYTRLLIRHGGHNQGGGGEQNAETWTLDPLTMKWEWKQPNTSPPGVCCERDNVFDAACRRFVRFPAFSNSHGWQWIRKIHLRNYTAWAYDDVANLWRNMRPIPWVPCSPGRGAAYDHHNGVVVVFAGEGNNEGTNVYDLYTNTWTRLKPGKEPEPRCYMGFAYDGARRKIVMFGSHYGNDARTWAFDLATNQWQDLAPAEHPPADKTAPVMAYDTLNRIMLCVCRSSEQDGKLQTWAYDPAANSWKKLEPEGDLGTSGSRNRLLVYLPDLNIFVMENRTDSEQQIWTYRYAVPKKAENDPPAKPADLAVVVSADGKAKLTWKPGPGEEPAGYRLYRGSGEQPWKARYAKVGPDPIKAAEFEDQGLEKGKLYFYRVAAVGKNGQAGDESLPARTQPRALDWASVSVLGEKEVEVAWKPCPEKDVTGYLVERADVEVYTTAELKDLAALEDKPREPSPVGRIKTIGQFTRLNKEPIKETVYLDKSVDLAKADRPAAAGPFLFDDRRLEKDAKRYNAEAKKYRFAVYAYRVRSVNALGAESGPSPFYLTIPEAVEGVFAKEDGGTVQLKWSASPEKKLKGYLVYRMNQRGGGQIPLLTPEPVGELTFTDGAAGKATHRYHVVAVDALGQEGIPSSPAWSNREWNAFYKPFGAGLGTWHQ